MLTSSFKWAVNLSVAAVGLIPFTFATASAAVCIALTDPGPVFYREKRIGKGGKEFTVYKIRTMYKDAKERLSKHLASDPIAAAEWKINFKLRNDPRILPGISRILRKFSLDELPQIINLINGTMNLVGPRPVSDYHIAALDPMFVELRQSVLPGLTGLWQVSNRDQVDTIERLDTKYIQNQSLMLDLQIIFKTALVVATGKNW